MVWPFYLWIYGLISIILYQTIDFTVRFLRNNDVNGPRDFHRTHRKWDSKYLYVDSKCDILLMVTYYLFFAKADLVHDLRPLAFPCCSNDYGKAKSGEKIISLRKGEIKQQSVQNSTSKQEFMYEYTYRSAKEYWQIVIGFRAWRITHRRFTQSSFTQSSVCDILLLIVNI